MPLNIRSEEVNQLAEKLAARKRLTKTDAVRLALINELRRAEDEKPLWERIKPLRDKIRCTESSVAAFDCLVG